MFASLIKFIFVLEDAFELDSELYHISGMMVEIEGAIRRQLNPLRGQRSHTNIYTIQIKESKIEIFNFVVLRTLIAGELAALRLTKTKIDVFYSNSFNFRHLGLTFLKAK